MNSKNIKLYRIKVQQKIGSDYNDNQSFWEEPTAETIMSFLKLIRPNSEYIKETVKWEYIRDLNENET